MTGIEEEVKMEEKWECSYKRVTWPWYSCSDRSILSLDSINVNTRVMILYYSSFFYWWHYYRCPHFPLFARHSPSSFSSGRHHAVVCVCGLCMYVLWLIPSYSFIQGLPAASPLTPVSLFHVSMTQFLFCFSLYFVH